jgi:type VI secretion system protein ImpL
MSRVLRFLRNWWVLTGALALFAAIVLVWLLPMLVHGLRPLVWRLLMLAGVVLIWGGAALWRVIAARRASGRLAQALAPEAASAAEGAAIATRMNEALSKLKADSKGRRDYLYSRPWYVIIGPPGAGKTTALLNSGLRFPVSSTALKGVGGTRNLDFWFAEEAVLVDTAGRYTSQDSSESRDREGWSRFLSLLRTNRPLQPINGVLVAIGLDTLAAADGIGLDRHAHIIRQRLSELREGLGTVAPVYVVFTKADLIAGFAEFFDDLDVEGRRSVLGATLPLGADAADAPVYAQAFDRVAQAVADRSSTRIQAELDTRRRGLIIGFPAQLDSLRDHVVRFLDEAFRPEADAEQPLLRGFYFTSGVQQGTPLDALLAGIAVDDTRRSGASERGRAYFLNRLLNEVVFQEAGLPRPTTAERKRRSRIATIAYASIAAVSALLLIVWASSFIATLGYQKQVAVAANEASGKLQGLELNQVSASDPGLADTLDALDTLRALPGGYDDRRAKGFPKFPLGLGLFDDGLSRSVEQAYLGDLQRIMLPRTLLRLEQYMRESKEATPALYSALRAYRLLGGDAPAKAQRSEVGSVANWVTADWAGTTLAGGDRAQLRTRLGQHLTAMLEDEDLGRVWGKRRRAPLDADLVGNTQNVLASLSPGKRGYALLVETPPAGRPWTPNLPESQLKAFANPQAVQSLRVPFLFTREGYRQYQVEILPVVRRLKDDDWVLGDQSKRAPINDLSVASEVGIYYSDEYTRQWRNVLSSLHPADYFRNQDAAHAVFTTPSPLTRIVEQVRLQTSLGAPGKLPGAAARLDAGTRITAAFETLRNTDIAAYLALLNKAWSASNGAKLDPTLQPAAAAAMNDLRNAAVTLPSEDLHAFAVEAAGQSSTANAQALGQEYSLNILPACRRVTAKAYPFVQSARDDASKADTEAVFGPSGSLTQFIGLKLASHIEPDSTWRWKTNDPFVASFQSSPARFQEAKDLRILLTDGLQMQIYALDFGPGVSAVELRIGSVSHVFHPNDPRPFPYRWSKDDNETADATFQGTPDFIEYGGPWAVFHLFGGPAKIENLRPDNVFKVTLVKRSSSAAFKVVLPSGMPNPFRGGPWNFRCPAAL